MWRFLRKKKLPTARKVAEYGYTSLMQGKAVAVYGQQNRLLLFLLRLTPRSVVRRIVKRLNG
jgi:short-subunit dehydrogenase